FELLVNVFRYHDTVINHQARRQDDTEHSEHVNGEATEIHYKECRYQGHGNVYQRTNGYPPVPEKEIDNENHENYRDEKSLLHFADRTRYKHGLVHRDVKLNIRGDFIPDLIHPFVKLIRDSHKIRPGQWHERQPHHRDVAFPQDRLFILGPQHRLSHIL